MVPVVVRCLVCVPEADCVRLYTPTAMLDLANNIPYSILRVFKSAMYPGRSDNIRPNTLSLRVAEAFRMAPRHVEALRDRHQP